MFLAGFVALLLVQTPVEARRSEVAVDWSAISDALVTRCELSGLESLIVQRLVDEGYAVVRRAGATGVSIVISQKGPALELLVRSAHGEAVASVPVAADCESSLQLEVLHRLMPLLKRVEAAKPPVASAPPQIATSISPLSTPPQAAPLPAAHPVLGLGVDVPGAQPMLAAQGGARIALHRQLSLDVGATAAVTWPVAVTTLEVALWARVNLHLSLGKHLEAVLGLAAAFGRHQFFDGQRSDGHFDGRVGLPVELWLRALPVGLGAMPYLRLVQVEHHIPRGQAFVARAWGFTGSVIVRLGAGKETLHAAVGD